MAKTVPIEVRQLPLLREASLREFVAAGSITKVEAVGRRGGFELQVHMGAAAASLGNTRGGVRLFASIGALASLLKRLDLPRFEVDATGFVAGRLRSSVLEVTSTAKRKRPLSRKAVKS